VDCGPPHLSILSLDGVDGHVHARVSSNYPRSPVRSSLYRWQCRNFLWTAIKPARHPSRLSSSFWDPILEEQEVPSWLVDGMRLMLGPGVVHTPKDRSPTMRKATLSKKHLANATAWNSLIRRHASQQVQETNWQVLSQQVVVADQNNTEPGQDSNEKKNTSFIVLVIKTI
jgi:2-polyprenyl-6-methoxyphenol hydroxylase-like FAD-dependent oxidoreductase